MYKLNPIPIKILRKQSHNINIYKATKDKEQQKKLNKNKKTKNNKNTVLGITIHGSKLCYRAKIIQTTQWLYKKQHFGQWNMIESMYLYVSPQSFIYLIFNGDAKNKHWREE